MEVLLLLMALFIIFRIKNNVIQTSILCVLFLWGCEESVYGVLQVVGKATSNNAVFALTGHFDNPGPYGGFIAIVMSIASSFLIKYRNHHRSRLIMSAYILAALCVACGFLVLPASMSRTAWVAYVIALCVCILSEKEISAKLRVNRRQTIILTAIVFVLMGIGVFAIKKESAIGRLHIWRIEALTILEHPWGTGAGTALGSYGKTQEQFFRKHIDEVPEKVIHIAGCPEYPFNEFLGIGIEYGVPGMLAFITLLGISLYALFRKRSVYCAGLAAWTVFAFASYPLSVPQTSFLFLLMVATAIKSKSRGKMATRLVPICAAIVILVITVSSCNKILPIVDRSEYRQLYHDGYSLYLIGDHKKSNELLSKGASISSDPVFHIIMGRNYEALAENKSAEEEYLTAHYMVPCRMYPLIRLMRLKLRENDSGYAEHICREIESMPVTKNHRVMQNFKDEAKFVLDSLSGISH